MKQTFLTIVICAIYGLIQAVSDNPWTDTAILTIVLFLGAILAMCGRIRDELQGIRSEMIKK